MIYLVFGLILVLALVLWPSYWVKSVLSRYEALRDDLPGTGGELAEHLKKRLQLDITVEVTEQGDHFDPVSKTVRLRHTNHAGKHLTAIATAAHEIGHAIQWQAQDPAFLRRQHWVNLAFWVGRAAQISLVLIPIFHLIPGGVVVGRLLFVPVVLGLFFNTLVHLVTLPVEWDASFSKALPLLVAGEYVSPNDIVHIRKILRACALTYVASAALSLLSFSNLLRVIRRG